MNRKQEQLCERVAKQLKMTPERVKNFSLEDIILFLVEKMEDDCIDIDELFEVHIATMIKNGDMK